MRLKVCIRGLGVKMVEMKGSQFYELKRGNIVNVKGIQFEVIVKTPNLF